MASWDDEDFEPVDANNESAQWDGEDEDDNDIKDNWDDDEDEEKEKDGQVPKSQPKKKKTLTEKIAEREEKRKQEALAKQQLEEPTQELTPEEEMDEKVRRQRLQEEADLEIAKDAFGIVELPAQKTIDNFMPSSKEEFIELSNMIVQKLSKLELRSEYSSFLETLVRDCCAGCEADEIKKIASTLNSLVQEKQKLNKGPKGKKKTDRVSKKTLASGKGMNDELDYNDSYYDEFDDFM